MIKAIFYKEWIKLRWYLLLAFLVSNAVTIYGLLRMNRAITLKGAGHIWEVMVMKNAIFIDYLEFVPLIVGILMALVQFVPEMQRKCLKLTLHLPYSQQRMTFCMLGSGFVGLLLCFLTNFITMFIYLPTVLPTGLGKNIISAALPWYLAGIASYLLTAWICLEPTWKRRILNLLISALVVRMYFLAPVPQAYNSFLPILTLYTLLLSLLSWISITRFKAGKQD